jgi:hypothetical protein
MSDSWTLDEALAWVLWRDLRIVEDAGAENIAGILAYPPNTDAYMKRAPWKPISKPGGFDDLLKALRLGHVNARGRKDGKGNRLSITSEEWSELRLNASLIHGSRAIPDDGGDGTVWTDLKFYIPEVQGYFPAHGKKKKTRTKNKGDGEFDDDELLVEMNKLIREKTCSSVRDAARSVVHRAKGAGTETSKVDRLRGKYPERFPNG